MFLQTKTLRTSTIKGLPSVTRLLFLGSWFHSLAFSTGNRFTPKSLQRRFKRHSCEVTKGVQPILGEEKGKLRKKMEIVGYRVSSSNNTPTRAHTHLFVASPPKCMRERINHNAGRHTQAGAYKRTRRHEYTFCSHTSPASTDQTPEQFLLPLGEQIAALCRGVSHHSLTSACIQTHTRTSADTHTHKRSMVSGLMKQPPSQIQQL